MQAIHLRTARIDARNKKRLDAAGQREKAVAAAPVYLQQRVAQGQQLPALSVVEHDNNEQLVACFKYALGLEGGAGIFVAMEGAEPPQGMVKEVFVELCELLAPTWARGEM